MSRTKSTASIVDRQAKAPEKTKLDQALAYADRGWAVFPIWSVSPSTGECLCGGLASCSGGEDAGKHPIAALVPRGVLNATTDQACIRSWWSVHPDANIGIATGEVSGIVILDPDGWQGFLSLAEILDIDRTEFADLESIKNEIRNRLPPTPIVETGGGWHIYFLHPGYRNANNASKIGMKLDIRGDGGYAIAPPSRHASGKTYAWLNGEGFDRKRVAVLPERLATAGDVAALRVWES